MMQRVFIPLIAAFLTLVGCTVHQYPEDGATADDSAVVDFTLNLRIPKQLPQYQTVDFVSKAGEAVSARYVVAFYKYKGGTYEDTPSVATVELGEGMADRSITVQIEPAEYHILAWVDYANPDGSSLYYDAESYSEVALTKGSHSGNNPYRDAYYGKEDISLSFLKGNRTSYAHTIGLVRPNARFEFIATDKEQFLKTVGADADLSNFRVMVTYPLFMPSTFNLNQERPTDASVGMAFTGPMTVLEDGNIGLGFDWVFAAPEDQTVLVSLSIYSPSGELLSTVNNIEVPLCPGKNTTVKGNLLTNGVSNGISINPGFEGDIVINI